jgi:hypothetical protein
MAPEAPPLLVSWENILDDLLNRTEKFPKTARFTFAIRIENLALDVMDRLTVARYQRASSEKTAALREADLALARLGILVRLAFRRRYLDRDGFRFVCNNLDASGRALGAWMASLEKR